MREWITEDQNSNYDLQRALNRLSHDGWEMYAIHWIEEPINERQYGIPSHWTIIAYRDSTIPKGPEA